MMTDGRLNGELPTGSGPSKDAPRQGSLAHYPSRTLNDEQDHEPAIACTLSNCYFLGMDTARACVSVDNSI